MQTGINLHSLESVHSVRLIEKLKFQITKINKQICQPGLVNFNGRNFNIQALFKNIRNLVFAFWCL
jgi:hypothetical protein